MGDSITALKTSSNTALQSSSSIFANKQGLKYSFATLGARIGLGNQAFIGAILKLSYYRGSTAALKSSCEGLNADDLGAQALQTNGAQTESSSIIASKQGLKYSFATIGAHIGLGNQALLGTILKSSYYRGSTAALKSSCEGLNAALKSSR